MEEQNKALEERDKALDNEKQKNKDFQKEFQKEVKLEMAKTLKENGVSTEVIQQKTNLSQEEIDQL